MTIIGLSVTNLSDWAALATVTISMCDRFCWLIMTWYMFRCILFIEDVHIWNYPECRRFTVIRCTIDRHVKRLRTECDCHSITLSEIKQSSTYKLMKPYLYQEEIFVYINLQYHWQSFIWKYRYFVMVILVGMDKYRFKTSTELHICFLFSVAIKRWKNTMITV